MKDTMRGRISRRRPPGGLGAAAVAGDAIAAEPRMGRHLAQRRQRQRVQQEESTLTRLGADTAFLSRMQAALHPGAVLIFTDAPLSPESRSGKDFVIMS